ncbi:MAG: aspartate-semialdehyde dehydrogenase [Pseudomonadota bacterium]
MSKTFDVAVLGATGLVGETILEILEQRKFPVGTLYPLASARSAGKSVQFRGKSVSVIDVESFDFSKAQIGLFSAGAGVSADIAPRAAENNCVVIDNTSQFRYDDDIPLVVPEVNPEAIANYTQRGIIANPNCSTIQMLVALKPIHDAFGIERITVSTYQAVSGAGRSGMEKLAAQTTALLNLKPMELADQEKQIAFNVLPHIDAFQENGYTKEEMKMTWETRKILGEPGMALSATAVRVPVFFGHSEAVSIETRKKASAAEISKLMRKAPGIKLLDEQRLGGYPTAVTESAGNDPVYVGRIREDISHERGICLWVVSDNVRKGAALNSVQIAEILVKKYL